LQLYKLLPVQCKKHYIRIVLGEVNVEIWVLNATLQFKVLWKRFKFLLEEIDLNTKLMKILKMKITFNCEVDYRLLKLNVEWGETLNWFHCMKLPKSENAPVFIITLYVFCYLAFIICALKLSSSTSITLF
jgi:hypothetical protein